MPSSDPPQRRALYPVPLGGVLDESRTPSQVGSSGLTACENLIYRRYGAWGKRPGSGGAYATASTGPTPSVPVSGIRWYPGLERTQVVLAAQGALWYGDDPNLTYPYAPLTQLITFNAVSSLPISFASAYDPNYGGNILIICGATTDYGFATGEFKFSGTPSAGQVVTLTLPGGDNVSYTVLPTDDLESIASSLSGLINNTLAVLGNPAIPTPPILNTTYSLGNALSSQIFMFAFKSGAFYNVYTYNASVTGAGLIVSPAAPTNLTGGGSSFSGPLKYEGVQIPAAVSGLSGQITQAFTGCINWHNHVWYWGDPNNPGTLYASDINQPEGFTFMAQNGGYDIGEGDGDPIIQTCIPMGNLLYVFKNRNIYAVSGYDFQTGEYEFNIQPIISGEGIPAGGCATLLNNAIVFWNGTSFKRLAVGAFQSEYIGRTIPLSSGSVIQGDASLMRAIGGNFLISTALTNIYEPPGESSAMETLTNVAIFACDIGNGVADTLLVYDDDASNFIGNYAWSPFKGIEVGAWIPFSTGINYAESADDTSQLFWISPPGTMLISQFGSNPTADSTPTGTPVDISWEVQTGWITLDTPALVKELNRIFLQLETTPGASFTLEVLPAGPVNGTAETIYPPISLPYPTTPGTEGQESYQVLVIRFPTQPRGYAYLLTLTESSATASYELANMTLDVIQEASTP